MIAKIKDLKWKYCIFDNQIRNFVDRCQHAPARIPLALGFWVQRLSTKGKIVSKFYCNLSKTPGRGSIHPSPRLGPRLGIMNLRVRLKVKYNSFPLTQFPWLMFHVIPVLKMLVHASYFHRAIERVRHFKNQFTLY